MPKSANHVHRSSKSEGGKSKKVKTNFKPYFIHYIYCLAIISLLAIAGINVNNYLNSQKVLGASINASPLLTEKSYWQNIVNKNPSYIDGYLELAKVDIELGNKTEAGTFINKALSLDPNSSKIPEVISKLSL